MNTHTSYRYHVVKNVVYRREYFGGILYDMKQDDIRSLNKTGADIFDLIKIGYSSPSEIIKALAAYYEVAEESIIDDVESFLEDHVKLGTIIRENPNLMKENSVTSIIHDLEYIYNQTPKEYLSAPLQINIHPYYKCNQKCIFCYAQDDELCLPEIERDELTENEIMQFIGKSIEKSVLYIGLLGGEPLLNKQLILKALETAQGKIRLGFTTNGTGKGGISVAFAKKLNALDISEVRVSIQGSYPELHDEIVGVTGAFENAMKSIHNLTDSGVTTLISCVAIKSNQHDILTLTKKAREWKTNGFHLLYLNPCGLATDNYWSMTIPPKEYAPIVEMLEEMRKKFLNKFIVTYEAPFHFAHRKDTLIPQTPFDFEITGCAAGSTQIEVDPYGDVYGCAFTFGDPQFILGNIKNNGIDEIWNNPKLDYFRKRDLSSLKSPECIDCPHKVVCRGGCPIVAEKYLGDSYMGDPRCPIIHERWVTRN